MTDSEIKVAGTSVSRETLVKLQSYTSLLEKWTKSINLIAPKTVPEIWTRHIVDSAQVLNLAPATWKNWVDLGSGGGLPGIVIAILDEQDRPITLIESDKRKCLFLNTVRRELSLNLTIENSRIEQTNILTSSVVSARALAPLPDLLNYSERLLAHDGIALLSKGITFQKELDQAKKTWDFDMLAHTSQTNSDARILEISRISRRES